MVSEWKFSSQRFPRAILQPFYQTQSCVSHVASFTPEKRRTPALIFHSFNVNVESPSTTSKISNPLNILLLQTPPNCLGRSWNPSTKRPERQLHSWTSMSATQHVWRLSQHEITSHLCFPSKGLPLPTSQLNDARMGVSAEENGSKNTYKAMILPDSCSCTRSKQTTIVTCIT